MILEVLDPNIPKLSRDVQNVVKELNHRADIIQAEQRCEHQRVRSDLQYLQNLLNQLLIQRKNTVKKADT